MRFQPATSDFCEASTAFAARPAPALLQCLGRIVAGIPVEAVEAAQREDLMALFTRPGRYPLRVCDDSMLGHGLFKGDTLILQSQQQARDGDLVLALVDNETTLLRRLRNRDAGMVELFADDHSLRLHKSRLGIQGKVVGLVRRYP